MKKILCYALSLLATGFLTAACGDNDDFSSQHVLSDDEIAEMARQQHIRDSLLSVINADLVLYYDVPITISSSAYDGALCPIATGEIAAKFGISEESLLAALGSETGTAADVSGFAIQGTTHADKAGMTNTGAAWGHWWNADGDVVAWGDDAMVFAEFDPDQKAFNVGQFPGHLKDGQAISFIEGLKYQDIRVAVVINVTAKARGEVKATVVSKQALTLETVPNDTYATVAVPGFDAKKLLADLGAASLSDVQWVAVKADGGYEQEYSADAPGFWYDKEGFAGSYGDNASVFTHLDGTDVVIGQMPGQMKEGSNVTVHFGALYNGKIVMLDITVKIKAYEDPETAPAGSPESIEKSVTLTQAYNKDWNNVTRDMRDELRQAFKMTTYQIFKAIKDGTLKMWVSEKGKPVGDDGKPAYTADAPGYWLAADGTAVKYASEDPKPVCFVSLAYSETELQLTAGNHPDNCSPTGQKVTTTYIIECNGVTATYHITFDITAK